MNCAAAEQGLEFAPFPIADFEGAAAEFLYMYTDDTAILHTDDPVQRSKGYAPPTFLESHCGAVVPSNEHVFHVTGGPFLAWGGGMGISMQHLYKDARVCTGVSPPPSFCPPLPADDPDGAQTINQVALDLSQWDGVALWARRGSNSQPLLRVLVGDKHTDDDLSYLMYQKDPAQPRYCERVRDCSCQGHTCDYYADSVSKVVAGGGYYCGFPGTSVASAVTMGQVQDSDMDKASNTCNVTRCDEGNPAYSDDPQFHGRACRPYAFKNGNQSSFCFNPGDPPPAEPDQQCGDHFTFPLHLTTQWQLYLVPFSSMSQQGWAKKAPFLDLKSVSVVRLTWDAGNIDYYIDDLRFYRAARP